MSRRPSLRQYALPVMDRRFWASRRNRLRFELLLVFALVFTIIPQASFARTPKTRVLPQLLREAAAQPDKFQRVIVTYLNDGAAATSAGTAFGGRKLKELPHNAFVMEVPGLAIPRLGSDPNVKFVAPDALMKPSCTDCEIIDRSKLVDVYSRSSAASQLWPAATGTSGWTGKGVGVAIVDTGIRARRVFNNAQGTSRIVQAPTFATGQLTLEDGHGHGTHVAGIVGGNSWRHSDVLIRGKYIGIAPEATLINVKVADDLGKSYISDVVLAIDWIVTNRDVYNIRVMNLSLVSSVAESATTSTLAAAVERAWFNGILVVVASGNAGPNTLYYPPANDPFVVTVGASDTMETVSRADDGMASWSSYGTTQDGYSKPDVVAPGRRIIAPLASTTSSLGLAFPGRIVDGDYIWLSGTSMAAPVVSGMAALVFQARPELTNDQFKWLLQRTASTLGGSTPLPGQGAGLVDVAAMFSYGGSPEYANQGVPINQQLTGPDGTVTYNTSSWSTSSWSTSSWSTSNNSTSTDSASTEFAHTAVE